MTAMISVDKSQTSIEKFKQFFKEEYSEEVSNLNYENRTIVIDYHALEIFDPYLADLLIDKPEDVIQAAQIAIENINKYVKLVNVRFKNVTNLFKNLSDVNSHMTSMFIVIDGKFTEIKKHTEYLEIGVFECKGCMRLHEIEEPLDYIIEPSLCSECGGRDFRLLVGDSRYTPIQWGKVGYLYEHEKTSRELKILFDDDLVSEDIYKKGQPVRLTGILKIQKRSNDTFENYLHVNHVEFLDYPIEEELEERSQKEYGARDTPEYREWKQNVLNRDMGICQCCGSDKHPEVHHIFSYEKYPRLRVDVDNGITLCKWCHQKYNSHFGHKGNGINFMKFIKRFSVR